jgi:hypothetical protein
MLMLEGCYKETQRSKKSPRVWCVVCPLETHEEIKETQISFRKIKELTI